MREPIYLADLIRYVGGWPINMERAGEVLARARTLFVAEGGDRIARPLTRGEIQALGFDTDKLGVAWEEEEDGKRT